MRIEIASAGGLAVIATIVVSVLGLTGHLNLYQVSVGNLTSGICSLNIPAVVASILGLCGHASVHLVSYVSLGGIALSFMLGSVYCVCQTNTD